MAKRDKRRVGDEGEARGKKGNATYPSVSGNKLAGAKRNLRQGPVWLAPFPSHATGRATGGPSEKMNIGARGRGEARQYHHGRRAESGRTMQGQPEIGERGEWGQ